MDPETNPSTTSLCRADCGFYGSSVTEGFCSKCFKDTLKRKQDPERLSPTASVNTSPGLMASSTDHTPLASGSINAHQPCGTACMSTGTLASSSSSASFGSTQSAGSSNSTLNALDNSSSQPLPVPDAGSKTPIIGSPASGSSSPAGKTKKNRCNQCNKKIGLTGFACRCGGQFCSEHRYSDAHSCSFDYKAFGQAEISKNNPVVVAAKIDKL